MGAAGWSFPVEGAADKPAFSYHEFPLQCSHDIPDGFVARCVPFRPICPSPSVFIVDVEQRGQNGEVDIGLPGRFEISKVPVEGERHQSLANDLPGDGVDDAALPLPGAPGTGKAVEGWLIEAGDPVTDCGLQLLGNIFGHRSRPVKGGLPSARKAAA